MSHMATSHVEQMGCGSCEDVSALGTAKVTSGSVALLDHLCAVSSRIQRLFHRVNAVTAFTLEKVGLRRFFRAHGRFPFECAATTGARTRVHVRASHASLRNLILKTRRPPICFNTHRGTNKNALVSLGDRVLGASASNKRPQLPLP